MSSVANLVGFIIQILTFTIIGRALLSWFDPEFKTAVGRIIYEVTEPIIGPIRKVMPSLGMFDISPIIALLLLQLLNRLIQNVLV